MADNSIYSQLLGSFYRGGNFPLEAHFIFNSETELLDFYKDPVESKTLYEGLFKLVKNDSKQTLYWCVNKDGNLTFEKYNEVIDASIQKEIQDRIAADNALQTNIDTEKSRAEASEQNIIDHLNTEISDRKTADTQLQGQIDKESQDRSDLALVVYNNHLNLSISANPNIIYKGEATNTNISWTSSLSGYTGDYNPTYSVKKAGQEWATGNGPKQDNINDTTKYDLDVTVLGVTKKTSVTINAYYPKYFFFNQSTDLVSSDQILAGNKQPVSGSAAGTWNVTVNKAASSVWFCVPDNMSISKITLNDAFAFPFLPAKTVAVNGKGNYKVYQSQNTVDAGTYKFTIS